MSEHGDADGGVHADVDTAMRTALTVAMQMADRMARLRTDLLREAERRDTDVARHMSARFEADRAVAVTQLDVVNKPEWWQNASTQDIAHVTEVAEAWRGFDPRADTVMETIGREVQDRYGIDVASLVAAERARAGDERVEAVQLVAEADRLDHTPVRDSQNAGTDTAAGLEAQALAYEAAAARGGDADGRTPDQLSDLAQDARAQAQLHPDNISETSSGADAAVAVNRADAGIEYDSAERRAAFAASMEGSATPEQIAVRMRADVDQARPAHEAVTSHTNPSRSRGSGTPTGGRQRDRGDRGR